MVLIAVVAGFAILAPGLASTALNAAQGWIVESLGWFYMLLVGLFIVFTLVVCFTRYGTITPGQGWRKTRVRPLFLVRYALRSRYGHRPGVLRCRRTADLRDRRSQAWLARGSGRTRALGDGADLRALGSSSVGHLRGDWSCLGLCDSSARSAGLHPLGRLFRTRGVFNRQAVKDDVRQDVRGKRRRGRGQDDSER